MISRGYWLVFILIFIPFLIAVWFYLGEPQYERLDIKGPVEVTDEGDTNFHTIPDFELTNQKGETISLEDLDDQIHVAKFIFTRCPQECPVMTNNMRRVQRMHDDIEDLTFLSFSIDPDHDTPDVLYDFAEQYDVDHNNWHFLTGDQDKIHNLAKDGYFMTVKEGDRQATDYMHSEHFVLIDKDRRIRGIYDGMDEEEVMTLKDEIIVLLHEYS